MSADQQILDERGDTDRHRERNYCSPSKLPRESVKIDCAMQCETTIELLQLILSLSIHFEGILMSFEIVCGDILKRLADLYGVATDIELAKKLGVASQTVSTWRSRNRVPYDKVVELAAEEGISLDFLVFGQSPTAKTAKVNSDLMRYLYDGMDDELFLHERIGNEPAGFDLLCRAYNTAISGMQGKDVDLSDPEVLERADDAIKDVVNFYHDMFRFISSSMTERKDKDKERSSVSQNFRGPVTQAGGGDINNNFGDKDK